ncbi:hypothetical protein [Kitasatospora cineracea]|uniref:Uncharacterized protein n=1 Tax=Kitasatospora cineracea TaxID=88074 RepID=A0A3N4R5D3_9ACTN|nr:hypothetical protein [Kitasatospora cineracea]RPE26599.1 hypothetical protein EDD38_7660 [Kitasatospora cineracea]
MTYRRPLGPGPAVRAALASAPVAQRRPAWLPEDPVAAARARQRELLARAAELLVDREEQVLDLDADELREIAAFARAMGQDPVAAVDQAVRAALAGLTAWEGLLGRLGEDLVAVAAEGLGVDLAVVEAGCELDERLRAARAALLAAVTEYHHGSSGPRIGPRPW